MRKKILALVYRTGLEHGVNEIRSEFIDGIDNVALGSSRSAGLCLEALCFLILTDIDADGDDLGLVSHGKPLQNDGGVETS